MKRTKVLSSKTQIELALALALESVRESESTRYLVDKRLNLAGSVHRTHGDEKRAKGIEQCHEKENSLRDLEHLRRDVVRATLPRVHHEAADDDVEKVYALVDEKTVLGTGLASGISSGGGGDGCCEVPQCRAVGTGIVRIRRLERYEKYFDQHEIDDASHDQCGHQDREQEETALRGALHEPLTATHCRRLC